MTKASLFAAAAAFALSAAASAQDETAVVEEAVEAVTETSAPDLAGFGGAYTIDDSHSVVTWKIKHLGLAPYTAQLETVTGSLVIDEDAPENSTISATIDPASADTDYTGEKDFDAEVAKLLGEDPITFTSTAVSIADVETGAVTGDLTFNGMTKPVTLDVTLTGKVETHPFAGAPAVGLVAEGVISRDEFGFLDGSPLDGALGDLVEIEISAEFIKAAAE